MKLATGDDDGNVKLYKFPCLEKDVILLKPRKSLFFVLLNGLSYFKKANFDVYYGHSSNITNLKFTTDNSHLISIGGDDLW